MSCHIKTKFNYTRRKIEIEKLYDSITNKADNKYLEIINDDKLKCDLKRYGLRDMRAHEIKDILTKDQREEVQRFSNSEDIIVRKADKGNTFVILNTTEYNEKLNLILQDTSKFRRLDKNPTDNIKKSLNSLISSINAKIDGTKMSKIIGHYTPGYIYCNPKIHKNINNPPMRPIISQIGTATYSTAKYLNSLLSPYLPKKHLIQSTYEFIEISKQVKSPKLLASLDVENLFTNVPINKTIDIIIENAYNHPTIPPPDLPVNTLRKLLKICTTETPFTTPDGAVYQQIDGVSMGSCLGVLFANFYMCDLENRILPTIPNFNQCTYCRYVDDIFLAVPDFQTLMHIRENLEKHSVLNFTYEIEVNRKIAFLDTLITKENKSLQTSVFTKVTNTGEFMNYHSICPERYKIGVLKTLLSRAYSICSNWKYFSEEVERIKQVLVNNNFPMQVIDSCINKFITSKVSNKSTSPPVSKESNPATLNTATNNPYSNNKNVNSGRVLDKSGTIVGEFIMECCRYSSNVCSHHGDRELNHESTNTTSIAGNAITDSQTRFTDKVTDSNETRAIGKAHEHNISNVQNAPSMNNASQHSNTHTSNSITDLNSKTSVTLYYCNQMTTNYKKEESMLKNIIAKNVRTVQNSKLKLHIYYRNRKLQQLFIRNRPTSDDVFNVVYQYSCNEESCNNSNTYIGYTTTLLKLRLSNHAQQGSIKKHHCSIHNSKVKTQHLRENTKVLTRINNRNELQIAEALLIKHHKPTLNEQNEFSDRTLKIF